MAEGGSSSDDIDDELESFHYLNLAEKPDSPSSPPSERRELTNTQQAAPTPAAADEDSGEYVLLTTAVDSLIRGMIVHATNKTKWEEGMRPDVAVVQSELRTRKPEVVEGVTDRLRKAVFGDKASVSCTIANMKKIEGVMDDLVRERVWFDIWSLVIFFPGSKGPVSGWYGSNLVVL
jgi:hypothetical protein